MVATTIKINNLLKNRYLNCATIYQGDYVVALFNFVDLFAGIGGFRIPCDKFNGQCIAFAERSKSAISIYESNFPKTPNLGNVEDIGKIASKNPIDFITAGIPCQPWSVAERKVGLKIPEVGSG